MVEKTVQISVLPYSLPFLLPKLVPMLPEKVKVRLRILQLPPAFVSYRRGVQIQDPCIRQCQQKGRMGSNDQLTATVPHQLCEKICQL